MKLKTYLIIILVLSAWIVTAQNRVTNIFYVQNTLGGFTDAPQSHEEKASLVKAAGFAGLEGFGYDGFFELRKALKAEGLGMPVNYVALSFEQSGSPENPAVEQIREMIKSSLAGDVIYFHLHSKGYMEDKDRGDRAVVKILRDLADYADGFGVKLCVYPHVSFYCETLGHSIRLAEMVDRKNFGAALNLCHLLKVEGTKDLDEKLRKAAPYLFAVNINGADDGDTMNFGWDRLIQPLGRGTFDTYLFVKVLLDNGYNGPFGLQCYNLQGSAAETLKQSVQVWEAYKNRYLEGY
jgi:sugar phosphate isomerase/epimerase